MTKRPTAILFLTMNTTIVVVGLLKVAGGTPPRAALFGALAATLLVNGITAGGLKLRAAAVASGKSGKAHDIPARMRWVRRCGIGLMIVGPLLCAMSATSSGGPDWFEIVMGALCFVGGVFAVLVKE